LLEIIDNADLSAHTSLRLQGRVDRLIRVHHPTELADAKRALRGAFRGLLGEGTNSVFGSHIQGSMIQIAWRGIERISPNQVRAQAGENWDELVQWSLCQELQGLENLSMIPGSVGAAPIQNIGAYGVELSQRFSELEAVHWEHHERKRFRLADCFFSYRSSIFKQLSHQGWIISQVDFQLNPQDAGDPSSVLHYAYPDLMQRFACAAPRNARELAQAVRSIRSHKLPDPNIEPNAGSFFHNPRLSNPIVMDLKARFPELPIYPDGAHHHKIPAAWMIERCGLKGQRQGDVGVSDKHALVLVNYGQASGESLLAFAQTIIQAVQQRFGLTLSIEPRVLLR